MCLQLLKAYHTEWLANVITLGVQTPFPQPTSIMLNNISGYCLEYQRISYVSRSVYTTTMQPAILSYENALHESSIIKVMLFKTILMQAQVVSLKYLRSLLRMYVSI